MFVRYPTRCQIVDVEGEKVLPGFVAATPPASVPHVGKRGLAERIEGSVRITLDDGVILWGSECWWTPITPEEEIAE